MTPEAGQQEIIAGVVDEQSQLGVAGLGSGNRALAGRVIATTVEGDMSGIVIGARTGSEGGGGQYSVFHLEIYDGETGLLAETVVTKPIAARGWHQINGILGSYAPESRQGYIRILKVSGANPFLAYGVVNDGGAPGERSGDGAYLPAR